MANLFAAQNAAQPRDQRCPNCNNTIPDQETSFGKGRPRVYCNDACRKAYNKAKDKNDIIFLNRKITKKIDSIKGKTQRDAYLRSLLIEHVYFKIGYYASDRSKNNKMRRQSEACTNAFLFRSNANKTIFDYLIAYANKSFPEIGNAIYDGRKLLDIARRDDAVGHDFLLVEQRSPIAQDEFRDSFTANTSRNRSAVVIDPDEFHDDICEFVIEDSAPVSIDASQPTNVTALPVHETNHAAQDDAFLYAARAIEATGLPEWSMTHLKNYITKHDERHSVLFPKEFDFFQTIRRLIEANKIVRKENNRMSVSNAWSDVSLAA
ncbi:hypothetical protein [Ketogulonicigenium vulgare]|uniref:hypothetical protein n=1 Tax=Ketogulonicigenium vulgare TaxID=92945 RepID=UPI0023582704|nr:hypothetical protein [Ketogulonicigenium vulgare]